MKSYSELVKIENYMERLKYLQYDRNVGEETFGWDRYLNQYLYRSSVWKKLRRDVIIRDEGCDMAYPGAIITGKLIIHHIEPLRKVDIETNSPKIYSMDNLVCVSHETHNAIHYGHDVYKNQNGFVIRTDNDTCPWRSR